MGYWLRAFPIVIPRSGYILARDQSMVESGVREGGKNTASFLFHEWTQQHKHEKKKSNDS